MGDPSQLDPTLGGGFDAMFVIIPVIIVIGIVATVGLVIYRSVHVARAGRNPLTLDTDIALAALDSPLLAPATSLEKRLREVDDLHARGVISDAEHASARAAILAG